MRLEKEKKFVCCECDLWAQPRNWSEFIHKFISHQRVRSRRSEEVRDVVIGIAKVLSSAGEGPLDSWSDKSYFTQVPSSLLFSFIRSRIGSSKIGLSQASRRSTLEYKAMIRGWSFSS